MQPPTRRRAVATLVALTLLLAGAVAATQPSSGITLSPALDSATAVKSGMAVEIGGQVQLGGGSSFIVDAEFIGYDAAGAEIVRGNANFNANRTSGSDTSPEYVDIDAEGNVDGLLTLGCEFGDATSMEQDQVVPACEGQTTTARDMQLLLVTPDAEYYSELIRIDPIPPVIEGYEVTSPTTILVTTSEPVTHPTGSESSNDWVLPDGEAAVVGVERHTGDCEYAPDEDPRGGADGCTFTLTVAPELDRDATPRVVYEPSETRLTNPDDAKHVDQADSSMYLRSVAPTRGDRFESLAADRVGPVAPAIQQVEGQQAEDPITGERLVLGNEEQPTVVVGDVTEGHPITVYVDGVAAGTARAVGDTATVVVDAPLADGQHVLTATAADEALCDPEDPDLGTCSNESQPSAEVTYDLDTVAPTVDGDVLVRSGASTISLQFTEDVDGADDPAHWSVSTAGVTITAVDDERDDTILTDGGPSPRRTLSYAGTIAPGATLTYTPPASDAYADEHTNTVAGFTAPLTVAALPVISLSTQPGNETDQSLTAPADPVSFTIDLGGETAEGTVTVDWTTTSGGDAQPDEDFTPRNGTITIESGESSAGPVDIDIIGDELDEFQEDVEVRLSNPQGAQLPSGSDTLLFQELIGDDDPEAVLGFTTTEFTVTEGGSITVEVALDTPSGKQVRVDWRTDHSGTATTADAPAQSGELVFDPGQTTQTFEVTTSPDSEDEPDEVLDVVLDGPVNATTGDADSATITITDDDLPVPTLSVETETVDEGTTGPLGTFTPTGIIDEPDSSPAGPLEEALVFTVRLSEPAEQDVTVDYRTLDSGSAIAGTDYTATSGTLTIPAEQTEATIEVDVLDDGLDEFDESVDMRFSNAVGVALSNGASTLDATGTISDNDPLVTVDLGEDVEVEEGNPATFEVALSAVSGKDVQLRYRATSGTAQSGDDFRATDDTLTIPAGDTTASFTVPTLDDATPEPTEDAQVTISVIDDDTAELGRSSANLEITDDDLDIDGTVVSLTGDAVEEGDPATPLSLPVGGNGLAFEVELTEPADGDVVIDYTTRAGTADAEDDFTPDTGQVTIADGDQAATVTIDVTPDFVDEPDEDLALVLTDVSGNAVLPDGELTRTGRILDDDPVPALQVSDATVLEGEVATFDVTLDNASARDVTVSWSLADNTATAGEDYTADSGTLEFPAGTTSRTVEVATLTDDTVRELVEQFDLVLAGADNADTDGARGTGSIIDVDAAGMPTATTVALEDITTEEADGDRTALVPVRLSSERNEDTVLTWSSQQLTATDGEDYRAEGGEVTIAAGTTSTQIAVTIIGDDVEEPNEDFLVLLTQADGAVITGPTGRVTIADDDAGEGGGPGGDDGNGGTDPGGDDVDGAPDTGDGQAGSEQDGALAATGGGAGFAVFALGLLAARRRREDG